MSPHCNYPDGLTEAVIDELIVQVDAEVALAARPTSALVDGSARARRCRRISRRAVSAVVRSLPARHGAAGGEGEAA